MTLESTDTGPGAGFLAVAVWPTVARGPGWLSELSYYRKTAEVITLM